MRYLHCLDNDSCQVVDETSSIVYFSGDLHDSLKFMGSYYGDTYCGFSVVDTVETFTYFNSSFLWTVKVASYAFWGRGQLGHMPFDDGNLLYVNDVYPISRIGNDFYQFFVIGDQLAKQFRYSIPGNLDIQKYDDTFNPIMDKLAVLKKDFDNIIDKVESLNPMLDNHIQVIESKIDSFVPSLDSSLDSSLVAFNNSLTTTTTSLTKDVLSASFAETVDTYFQSFGASLSSISLS